MKKIIRFIEEYLGLFISLLFAGAVLYGIYKIAAGTYHLIDKLIDKL